MDQLTLYINGFEESVAIMGVALGETSANVLTSFTHNFYLCLDNDQAGLKAAERVHDLLIKKGIISKYVDLSPYKDPDDFINGLGKIAFEQRLREAKLMIDLQIDLLMPEELPEVVDRKIEILQKVYHVLAPLKMDLRATERIVALSNKIGLETSKDQIISNYQRFLAGSPRETTVPALSQNLAPQPPPPMNENQYIQELISAETQIDQVPLDNELEVNNAHLRLVEVCILNPEVFEWNEMQEILEIIDQNKVKELVLELKNFYFEFDEQSYNTAIEKLVSNSSREGRVTTPADIKIREHVGVSLFKRESSYTPKI